ncbi:PTS mannose transporter subunit IIA [Enterococcus durans]|uniref:PTS sugar transporter subunit IIA n=1 Tax=Enterococcus durans TaxID=53345 RepID=UPI00232F2846|nr:PTS mannose transporter subunit IIA [Enterococcus durans]MDB1653530.1 PTS mannose transporter subunit IIA [Enterococcus durans]MDB1656452.1 PTS mannose transporter subunit IIA [Enterococcus durans]MDB1663696.1 PTS mannose transporter subunit IIA [Enterococcus durans]MDB1670006.1 PTS mannose transporter subunit IIA [Enterococcus durans]MDB1672010.1 PTS mannose transporter subunit IIA [Enterococcus durans]
MKFIFVSHGDLAKSLLGSTQMIVGEQQDAVAFGLYPKDDISKLTEKIEKAVTEMGGEDIICFTDLFSGSPFNVVVSLMGKYPIYHITGMNLPLVLEAFMLRLSEENDREAICNKLLEQAPGTFIDVKKYLEENLGEE